MIKFDSIASEVNTPNEIHKRKLHCSYWLGHNRVGNLADQPVGTQ